MSHFQYFINSLCILPNSKSIYIQRVPLYTSDFTGGKTYHVFIWKQSTIDSYSWEEIKKKNIYDAKLVYTLEELKAMDFIITYNGD